MGLWVAFYIHPMKQKNQNKRSRVAYFLISSYHTKRVGQCWRKFWLIYHQGLEKMVGIAEQPSVWIRLKQIDWFFFSCLGFNIYILFSTLDLMV